MTKFSSSLIVGSVWFGLVVLMSGSEVVPIYGSELATILFSALTISVAVTLLGLVAILLGVIGGAILGVIVGGDSVGVGTFVGMIFGVIATYTFEFFLIRDILPDSCQELCPSGKARKEQARQLHRMRQADFENPR